MDDATEDIIALERGALDRWGKGDPDGFFAIMGADLSYFDPTLPRRVDGLPALRAHLHPFAGTFTIDRYDMIEPRVQQHGDTGILTFNLVNYRTLPDGSESVINRWNATEAYARIGGEWRLVHSHWSYVQPIAGDTVAE
jgi:ketosteroid isomerase-like protein